MDMDSDGRREAYMEALRRHVCAVCLDGRGDGSCGLNGRHCALEVHLPRVVEVIAAVQSNRMDDYIKAIESQICGVCELGEPGANCRLRNAGECALASYLSLVIDAVEEVNQPHLG